MSFRAGRVCGDTKIQTRNVMLNKLEPNSAYDDQISELLDLRRRNKQVANPDNRAIQALNREGPAAAAPAAAPVGADASYRREKLALLRRQTEALETMAKLMEEKAKERQARLRVENEQRAEERQARKAADMAARAAGRRALQEADEEYEHVFL
ncbi:hypothetical protein E4U41_006083 [Claviceps citrina]|nr:hypothetical protein E4U41_006083 [Claviceps citrina]